MIGENLKEDFVIIARGGKMIRPYVSHVTLSSEDPDWLGWLEVEGDDPESFDDWCNFALNELVNDLEVDGAECIVLSLNEYRNLPKF
jgi:hypothetical protein